ncbi:MAG: ABC transporter permease [Bellilinea sp.]
MKSTGSVRRQILQHTLSFFSAILAALILGLLLLWLDGKTPRDVLNSAFTSTFASNFRFANMVSRLLTIVLVALASAIPFKAGIWNIGADGQLAIGGFSAALIGFSLTGLAPAIHIPLAILAGMLGGAIWAAIPALLRLRFRANEIVTTIMMNYLALLLTGYLVNYPFRAAGSANAETPLVQDSAILTRMVPLSNLSTGLFLAIIAFLVIYFLDRKTTWGYEWRVLGANEEFGRYGGVSDKKMRFLAMCLGGALAGLAGSILVLGVYHKFILGMGGSVGFTGILIALIAANSPALILVVSMIFAILQSSMVGMESKIGVATEFSDIVQSLIILMVITRSKLWSTISKIRPHGKPYGNAG